MRSHCEITIVLTGPIDIVMGEAQKVFDATCEVEPSVFNVVSFEYFNQEDKE